MRILIFFLLLTFSLEGLAQTTITGAEFLATAKNSESFRLAQEKTDFLNKQNPTIPLINDIEIRTETHDFEVLEQEFSLRFTPTSLRKIRATEEYHNSFTALTEIESKEKLYRALKKHYLLLVEYQHILPYSELKQEHIQLLKKKNDVLRAKVDSPEFDINALVQNEESIFELEEDLLKLQQQYDAIREEIKMLSQSDSVVTNFISISDLQLKINSLNNFKFLEEDITLGKQQLLDAEYEQELADAKNWFDFVQAQYGGSNSDLLKEKISLGAAFRLPLVGDKKTDLLEIEYKKFDEEIDLKEEITEKNNDIQTINRRIQHLIERLQLLTKQSKDSQATYALAQLRRMNDANPLKILQIEEVLLNKRIEIHKLRHDIYKNYAQWLNLTEMIISLPLKDHINKGEQQF